MIPVGIFSSKHLVSLNGGCSEFLRLVGTLPKEDRERMPPLPTPRRRSVPNTPRAFRLRTYWVIHRLVVPPAFRLPTRLTWNSDGCCIVRAAAESQSRPGPATSQLSDVGRVAFRGSTGA